MLRISTIQNEGTSVVLRLEGKLLEPWIDELQHACRVACERTTSVTIDLAGLTFVDAPGAIALRDLERRGVKLVGCSPLIAQLLSETTRRLEA